MWNHKQLLSAATRGSLLVQAKSRAPVVLRKPVSAIRCLSSAAPDYHHHHHDDDDQHADNYSKSQEALQKLLTASSTSQHETQHTQLDEQSIPTNDGAIETENDLNKSPTELTYTGGSTIPVTSDLHIVAPQDDTPRGVWPIFRIMDEDGTFRDGSSDSYRFETRTEDLDAMYKAGSSTRVFGTNPSLHSLREKLKKDFPRHASTIDHAALLAPSVHTYPDIASNDSLLRAYTQMVRLREMDTILQNAQRQGRISFYMTCHGEEAIHIGAASALELRDTVLAQYREAGVLMWRGFTLNQFTDQCFSNAKDLGKGRQMPVHYGSRALNYQTISSPLGTQIPQAAGAAYRLKLARKDAVAACFFGDGCASTTDFHSGLNFAATLGSPVIFFCRNNGYAISTPVTDQYVGDGIISRAPGYGMAAIRIDGNDIFAVHEAVRKAREYALQHNAPVLIEAMTYRQGHHSTSDDSLRYRSAKEVQSFADRGDPIARLQKFMKQHAQLTADDFAAIEHREKMAVIQAMREAEQKPKPPLDDLFEDVYNELPKSLQEQQRQLNEHLQKYPKHYQ